MLVQLLLISLFLSSIIISIIVLLKKNNKWKCNQSTGSCVINPKGPYTSQNDCNKKCTKSPPPPPTPPSTDKYSCDTSTGSCVINPKGPYTSQNDCNKKCTKSPPTDKYLCNQSTGSCEINPKGTYNTKTECNKKCTKSPPPPPPPTPPSTDKYSCNLNASNEDLQCNIDKSSTETQTTCKGNCPSRKGVLKCINNNCHQATPCYEDKECKKGLVELLKCNLNDPNCDTSVFTQYTSNTNFLNMYNCSIGAKCFN